MILLACAVLAVLSFWATSFYIERGLNFNILAPRSTTELAMRAGGLLPATGAAVDVRADGLRLTSRFTPGAPGSIEGAAYSNFAGPQIVTVDGRALRIEIDASLEASGGGEQVMELLYVQNGLHSSPWLKMLLAPGRRTYSTTYTALTEKRGSDRVDTLWLRADAAGQGRAITIHALRLFTE